MKYMLMIYRDEALDANLTEAEYGVQYQEYTDYSNEVDRRGLHVASEAFHPVKTATSVRVRDGKITTSAGPFAETAEQLGGFYILDCKDLDEAIEMAARVPGARDGSVEIRP